MRLARWLATACLAAAPLAAAPPLAAQPLRVALEKMKKLLIPSQKARSAVGLSEAGYSSHLWFCRAENASAATMGLP